MPLSGKTGPSSKRRLWRENHGTFLAGFAALLLVLGAVTITFQSVRYHPPRFPRQIHGHSGTPSTEEPNQQDEAADEGAVEETSSAGEEGETPTSEGAAEPSAAAAGREDA